MRRYKSGTRWGLWLWTDVDWQGETYLLRLHLLKTPWFAVMLHWIKTADPHADPHDHPVDFLSVTLRGSYREWLPARWPQGFGRLPKGRIPSAQRVHFHRAEDIHRIALIEPGTLTLVMAGPSRRIWGFWTDDGWVDWKIYRDRHAR